MCVECNLWSGVCPPPLPSFNLFPTWTSIRATRLPGHDRAPKPKVAAAFKLSVPWPRMYRSWEAKKGYWSENRALSLPFQTTNQDWTSARLWSCAHLKMETQTLAKGTGREKKKKNKKNTWFGGRQIVRQTDKLRQTVKENCKASARSFFVVFSSSSFSLFVPQPFLLSLLLFGLTTRWCVVHHVDDCKSRHDISRRRTQDNVKRQHSRSRSKDLGHQK